MSEALQARVRGDTLGETPATAAGSPPVSAAVPVSRHATYPTHLDPRIEALVKDLIGRVADKWTLLLLEVLEEAGGPLRFTRLSERVEGISQKMLTQTLRQMERDGLVHRKIYPVIPPKVEYSLTPLGHSLGEAFCGVWIWAAHNLDAVEGARSAFDARETE
ncbi:ArsR family transcriptional regulator [Azorhizobium oxalatiphilum]|uniref:ArsR family transcriptional regulator n=1 Tax=Azorhizobium oxalatiphilum TaxID=980631 RepID=A0A917BLU9_9HYPH|nr:helix-turn-helix domain-containing protein [Azorhizobium oxalatiphilum]GGF47544.1 ArsR family transcriptional regulator [Azorhizobium oxalatiphilum]